MWLRCSTSRAFSGASSHSWLVLLLDRRRRPHWRRHRPGTPPRALLSAAQRRCIHRQAGKCRKGRRGCCSMGGELECTEGELRDERDTNELQQRSAVSTALYSSGNTEPLDLGSCRLPTPLTQSLSRDSVTCPLNSPRVRSHLQKLIGCIYPLYAIRFEQARGRHCFPFCCSLLNTIVAGFGCNKANSTVHHPMTEETSKKTLHIDHCMWSIFFRLSIWGA